MLLSLQCLCNMVALHDNNSDQQRGAKSDVVHCGAGGDSAQGGRTQTETLPQGMAAQQYTAVPTETEVYQPSSGQGISHGSGASQQPVFESPAATEAGAYYHKVNQKLSDCFQNCHQVWHVCDWRRWCRVPVPFLHLFSVYL